MEEKINIDTVQLRLKYIEAYDAHQVIKFIIKHINNNLGDFKDYRVDFEFIVVDFFLKKERHFFFQGELFNEKISEQHFLWNYYVIKYGYKFIVIQTLIVLYFPQEKTFFIITRIDKKIFLTDK